MYSEHVCVCEWGGGGLRKQGRGEEVRNGVIVLVLYMPLPALLLASGVSRPPGLSKVKLSQTSKHSKLVEAELQKESWVMSGAERSHLAEDVCGGKLGMSSVDRV